MMKLLTLGFGLAAALDGAFENPVEDLPGYIVVLKNEIEAEHRFAHMKKLASSFNTSNVLGEWDIGGQFKAYIVDGISAKEASILNSLDEVKYVENNFQYHIMDERAAPDCQEQSAPRNWGLTRVINDGALPSPNRFEWDANGCGQGVDVHILDTGIQITHSDFAGRATWETGGDYTGEGENDGHGHGTHVASTAAGEQFGVARCARIVAQKVCNRGGSCPAQAQFGGLAAVAAAARAGLKKIVANMSLGGAFRQSSNDAVNAAHDAGASIAVAAGNSNNNACTISPASAEKAYTVMASQSNDARSGFSSWGSCCQIFAPGSSITAAWIGSNTNTRSVSGTSMASPHTAGALTALWSSMASADNQAVERRLSTLSNSNRITNPGPNSPNELLHIPCDRRP